MPGPQDLLARMADPNQGSVFDSTMQQVMRRLAQALMSGELKGVAMGATSPVKGGQVDLMRKIPIGSMRGPVQVMNDVGRFGYGDLAEGAADALLSGRRSQITMPGMQRMIRNMGYDEPTQQIATEASNNPDFLQNLLDMVLWTHGPGR